MSGSDVRTLQADLTKAGFKTPAVGIFGPTTANNVKRFERRYHLRVDGVATPAVVRKLQLITAGAANADSTPANGGTALGQGGTTGRKATKQAARAADPTSVISNSGVSAPVVQDGGSQHLGERTLHQGMHGHDVRVLQGYLTLAGFATAVDGDFGPGTEANVVKFEQANGLTANGVVTYAQSQALGRRQGDDRQRSRREGHAEPRRHRDPARRGAAGRRGRDQRRQLDHRHALPDRRRPRQVERHRL